MKSNNQLLIEPSVSSKKIKIKRWSLSVIKGSAIFASFILLSQFFSLLSKVNGTDIPESYFSGGEPAIVGLLNSDLFMGIIFVITLTVFAYVIYLLWQLHEIAVHKTQKINSHQANLVFALSLCGLFLHKGWWVLAVIIAFTNWIAISKSLSAIIRNGLMSENKSSEE